MPPPVHKKCFYAPMKRATLFKGRVSDKLDLALSYWISFSTAYRNPEGAMIILRAAFAAGMALFASTAALPSRARFEQSTCPITLPSSLAVDCGVLIVPENLIKDNGHTVSL